MPWKDGARMSGLVQYWLAESRVVIQFEMRSPEAHVNDLSILLPTEAEEGLGSWHLGYFRI